MPCVECRENTSNPRFAGSCIQCGHLIVDRPRDLEYERSLLTEAGKRAGIEVTGFGAYRERRAGDDHVRQWKTRDFRTECREELADCANYLVWWAERSQEQGDDPAGLFAALQQVISAYKFVCGTP